MLLFNGIVGDMPQRFCMLICLLVVSACDSETSSSSGGSGMGCRASTELWILPTLREATQLDDAFKSRQRGTSNLLLAKYHSKSVPEGTKCDLLEEKQGFGKITAKPDGLTGWVPLEQVRDNEN